MTEDQIKHMDVDQMVYVGDTSQTGGTGLINNTLHMVDRFLGWRLPENFNPDDGVSFEPIAGKGGPHPFRRTPSGTNLLDAEQATAMVRHMLEGLPSGS